MKKNLLRGIAMLLCAVMLFTALPTGAMVYAADAQTDSTELQNTKAGDTTEKNLIEIIGEFISIVKNVILDLSGYVSSYQNEEEKRTLEEAGIMGYLFDPKEGCFYTSSDPWQRVTGYNQAYDIIAPTVLIDFDTVRFKFDYEGKKWLLQVWKGQYGALFYGAEIGLYNKPANRWVEHYDCASDDERLQMSMDFYEYKKFFGKGYWKKQFSRPYDYYWWCTGFIPGNRNDEYEKLRVDARITAADYDMLSALTRAIEKEGIICQVSGLDIRFTYH